MTRELARKVTVGGEVIAALHAEARKEDPRECCGILLGDETRIVAILPAENVSEDPQTGFEIDPACLIAAHRSARAGGPAVAGYYHSHPTGDIEPSATDRALAARDERIWAIVTKDGIGWWRDGPDGFAALERRG